LRSRIAIALALVLAAPAVPARAVSLDEAFAGYSALTGGDSGTRHGWNVAFGSGRAGLGFVVDLGGHMGSAADTGDDLQTLSLMAGPRLRFGGGRVRPFVHVIGGVVRTRASVHVFDVDISESATDFGGAAGGGLDLGFGPRWALRVAGDYRVVKADEGTVRDPRVSAGIVYRFGAR
jgi:opacity protein-like surface antigen